MSRRLRSGSRSRRRPVTAAVTIALPLLALAGCATDATERAADPTSGAITACLTAAQEQGQLDPPTAEGDGIDVSVEVDDQGWWAVVATTRSGATTSTLTCTAVPDTGPLGARAASWSVSDA